MDKSLQFVKFHLTLQLFISHICVKNIQSSRGDQTVGNFTKVDRDVEKMDMSNSDNDDSFINSDEDVMSLGMKVTMNSGMTTFKKKRKMSTKGK